MATTRITAKDVSEMASHWLRCRPNGYLGSRYGSDVKSLLQSPMAAGLADGLIAKARQDVPMLQAAGHGAVNLYSYDRDMDTKVLVLEVGDQLVETDGKGQGFATQVAGMGDVFAPNAAGAALSAADLLNEQIDAGIPTADYF